MSPRGAGAKLRFSARLTEGVSEVRFAPDAQGKGPFANMLEASVSILEYKHRSWWSGRRWLGCCLSGRLLWVAGAPQRGNHKGEHRMTSEDPETPAVSKLVSVPGIAALAVLGIAVIALSRAFGAENVLREMVTEVVAGFGNAILILAIFGLFFKSGLERILRRAPGGDTLAEIAEHLREILQEVDQNNRGVGESRYEAKLDRIEEGVRSLAGEEVPELRREVEELRKVLLKAGQGRET